MLNSIITSSALLFATANALAIANSPVISARVPAFSTAGNIQVNNALTKAVVGYVVPTSHNGNDFWYSPTSEGASNFTLLTTLADQSSAFLIQLADPTGTLPPYFGVQDEQDGNFGGFGKGFGLIIHQTSGDGPATFDTARDPMGLIPGESQIWTLDNDMVLSAIWTNEGDSSAPISFYLNPKLELFGADGGNGAFDVFAQTAEEAVYFVFSPTM